MRVLVVTPWLPPLGGGLERYAATVALHLAARGDDVILLAHAPGPSDGPRDGVRFVGVRPEAKLSNTPLSRALGRRARELIRDEGIDVVHAHTPVPGSAEMAHHAAKREGVPFVVTYHAGALASGSRLFAPAAALHRATFERAMLAGADARIAVSDFVARNVFAGRECTVIPPGVDADRFTPGGAPTPGLILFVGPPDRGYAWKGLRVLADAVRLVPGARLRVVGDGDLAERYRAEGVDVAGRVPEEALPDEYRAASVVALPSLTPAESFGMVLAEANACGRPVVGSTVGGIPSFVRNGENGLLVPPGDAAALADALRRILDDPALARRMGEAGRARVGKEHRWEDVATRTRDVLIGACGRAPRRIAA